MLDAMIARLFCATMAMIFGLAAASAGERRVALVIGNAAYAHVERLANPSNDAQDVAAALRKVGFEVVEARDLGKRSMDNTLAAFARLVEKADVALFFYAGHGVQFQGRNYLLPVDADIADQFSLPAETMPLEEVTNVLAQTQGMRILLLDACRNNPFSQRLSMATRSLGTRGLARLDRSEGMVAVYATQADQVAIDGKGRNSPFSAALVRGMAEPNVEIGPFFRKVARDVNETTGGRQTPEVWMSILGDFYFNKTVSDVEVWSSVKASSDPAEIQGFIARFPNSLLVDAAKARLDLIDRQSREKADRDRTQAEQANLEYELREQLALAQAERRKAEDELAARDRAARTEKPVASEPGTRQRALADREALLVRLRQQEKRIVDLEAETARQSEHRQQLPREPPAAAAASTNADPAPAALVVTPPRPEPVATPAPADPKMVLAEAKKKIARCRSLSERAQLGDLSAEDRDMLRACR